MRTLLVTGASSFVGRYLLQAIEGRWPRVILISRKARTAPAPGFSWVAGDLVEDKLKVPQAEAAIHLAPLPLLPRHIPYLQSVGVKQVVAVGTTSRFTKAGSSSKLDRRIVAVYSRAEDEFASLCDRYHLAWTLLRATVLYDGRSDKNICTIARVIRRWGFFPVVGAARGLRQPLHAQDLAVACAAVLDQPRTIGRSYNLAGAERLTYWAMVERIFQAMGRHPRIVVVPRGVFRIVLACAALHPRYRYLTSDMADRMNHDMVFDISDAQRDFGFAPRPFRPVFAEG